MVDEKELWIGDLLRVKASGRVGKFAGLASDGRIRIESRGKNYLISAKGLDRIQEPSKVTKLENLEKALEQKYNPSQKVESEIDLHIEKLNLNLVNALPERIVDYQIKAFQSYLTSVISHRLNFVKIIHGRGLGVLRSEIHSYLKSTKEVAHFHLVHNDGATEVTLKY